MRQSHVSRSILTVYFISFFYWLYLASQSISADLIGYKELGCILQQQGIVGYLTTGPHREPLYPLLCAWAMNIESLSSITFTHIMAGVSILVLLTTQILAYIIMRELNIRTWISCLVLIYLAISPVIDYSAFNILLFSEILTYPLVLAVVLVGHRAWNAIKQNNKKAAYGYGALSGLIFMALTLVKAAFEGICPAYFMVFLVVALYKKRISSSLICFLAAAGLLFYVPIIGYKCLNKKYNGNFVIADRGVVNFYGNAQRRTGPLTLRKYLADLSSVAGVCEIYFKPQECYYWTFNVSDSLGYQKSNELARRHLPPQAVTDALLRLSKEKILNNLPQYSLLTATESLKMYFWEASSGFNPLRFLPALLTFFTMLYCCFSLKHLPGLMGHALAIIFLFVFFYSFFAILPRDILPVVPLYIISIGYSLNAFLFPYV